MKTIFILSAFLCSGITFGQLKDYTDKQLLKNDRVLEFARNEQTKPKNIVSFLKCLTKETNISEFKKLPFFTGDYPLIVDERIKEHNSELWETIILECRSKEIFTIN